LIFLYLSFTVNKDRFFIMRLGVITPFITTESPLHRAVLGGGMIYLWQYKIQSPENSKTNNMRSFAFWYGTGIVVGVAGLVAIIVGLAKNGD
jgi:hypothetical protein